MLPYWQHQESHRTVVEPRSVRRAPLVGQDNERGGRHQHDSGQVLLGMDVEVGGAGEGDDHQIGEEDPILVVLGPERAPIEKIGVGVPDHGHVVPLIPLDDVHAVVGDQPEDDGRRGAETDDGEGVDQPRIEAVDPTVLGDHGGGQIGVEVLLDVSGCHVPLHHIAPDSRSGSDPIHGDRRPKGYRVPTGGPEWSAGRDPEGRGDTDSPRVVQSGPGLGAPPSRDQRCDARADTTYCPPTGSRASAPSTERPSAPPNGVKSRSERVTSAAPAALR